MILQNADRKVTMQSSLFELQSTCKSVQLFCSKYAYSKYVSCPHSRCIFLLHLKFSYFLYQSVSAT